MRAAARGARRAGAELMRAAARGDAGTRRGRAALTRDATRQDRGARRVGAGVLRAAERGGAGTRRARAACLALLLLLVLAAPAHAAPELVTLGSFSSPTYATAPVSEPSRVFVTERAGRVRVIVGGVVQATPFLDLTAITRANEQERGLLSIAFAPDYASSGRFYVYLTARSPLGEIQIWEYRRSATDANVADPGSGRLVLAIGALGRVQPQRRAAAVRARREAVARDRRRRRLQQHVRALPGPALATREAAAAGSVAGSARGRAALTGAAQPLAVLVRARRPDRDRRRRPGAVGGDQRRARRQLRLAVPRGRARLPVRPGLRRRRDRRPGAREGPRRQRRVLRDRRRLRDPRSRACHRCSAATSTATTAPPRCAPWTSRTRPATRPWGCRCRR